MRALELGEGSSELQPYGFWLCDLEQACFTFLSLSYLIHEMEIIAAAFQER